MRQIIKNKLYDTETAELVYAWSNGRFVSDFGYRSKTLYKTAKGALFLHHEGGAQTDVSTPREGGWRGPGEKIEPMSEKDAIAFLESRGPDASPALLENFAEHIEEA